MFLGDHIPWWKGDSKKTKLAGVKLATEYARWQNSESACPSLATRERVISGYLLSLCFASKLQICLCRPAEREHYFENLVQTSCQPVTSDFHKHRGGLWWTCTALHHYWDPEVCCGKDSTAAVQLCQLCIAASCFWTVRLNLAWDI